MRPSCSHVTYCAILFSSRRFLLFTSEGLRAFVQDAVVNVVAVGAAGGTSSSSYCDDEAGDATVVAPSSAAAAAAAAPAAAAALFGRRQRQPQRVETAILPMVVAKCIQPFGATCHLSSVVAGNRKAVLASLMMRSVARPSMMEREHSP